MARLLAIAAHPDDETGFAGGFLAKNVAEGNELYLLEATRGEGGEVGDPPVGPKSHLGEFREQEMRCAAAALGAVEVRFLDFIDPAIEIGEPPLAIAATMEEYASALAAQIAEIRPDILITHGTNGEYGHPQHVYTHHAVREALRRLAPWFPRDVLTWCASAGVNAEDRITNRDDPADLTLDVAPWLDRKVAAMECHKSQHAMFLRNSKAARVQDMVRKIEAFRRWGREEWLAPEESTSTGGASSDWRVPGQQK